MQIYLPIAEMSVAVETLLALGTAVGFLSGLFGVGGGFLLTPFLIFLGIPPAIAVATQANQLVASSVSGVLGHWRRDNVDGRMGGIMLAGGFLGSGLGVVIFRMLQHLGYIDVVISVMYVLLLGGVGFAMLGESVVSFFKPPERAEAMQSSRIQDMFRAMPYKMRFPKSRLYISVLLPGGIGFLGGLLVSTLGIGGGFLLVPAMIYILGMPTLLVAGTSLFQIIFTTALATLMHAVANQTVDIVLAVLLIIGGVIGTQIGVRFGKYLKGVTARVILALILCAVSFMLAMELVMTPETLYSTVIR